LLFSAIKSISLKACSFSVYVGFLPFSFNAKTRRSICSALNCCSWPMVRIWSFNCLANRPWTGLLDDWVLSSRIKTFFPFRMVSNAFSERTCDLPESFFPYIKSISWSSIIIFAFRWNRSNLSCIISRISDTNLVKALNIWFLIIWKCQILLQSIKEVHLCFFVRIEN